jgi:manganese/iron transport system substrate-binding protein
MTQPRALTSSTSGPTSGPTSGRRAPAVARIGTLLLATLLAAAACAESVTPAPASGLPTAAPDTILVAATTTVFADIVAQVGGPAVEVISLVPRGGEVHTFDPTPSTLLALAEARLVVGNGLGLDTALTRLVADTGSSAQVLLLGENLPDVTLLQSGGEPNPHLWLNVTYGRAYATRIAGALQAAAPQHADEIVARAAAYDAELADLDAWVHDQIGTIPPEARRIISLHEAFPYFAQAYGLEIVGSVISNPGQEPSASEITSLIEAIRASGARAIFAEAQFSDKLAQTIAQETGVTVESNLYNDSVGDAPADTYAGLIRWDVEQIVAALNGASGDQP